MSEEAEAVFGRLSRLLKCQVCGEWVPELYVRGNDPIHYCRNCFAHKYHFLPTAIAADE